MLRWFKKLFNQSIESNPTPRYESIGGFKFYTPLERLHNEHHPAVITPDSTKIWYLHGKVGRRDGPSVETLAGSCYWFDDLELHRNDGPAVEHVSGVKLFYLHGRELSIEEWLKRTDVAKEKKVELVLIYS
jgi:hypothetical protein